MAPHTMHDLQSMQSMKVVGDTMAVVRRSTTYRRKIRQALWQHAGMQTRHTHAPHRMDGCLPSRLIAGNLQPDARDLVRRQFGSAARRPVGRPAKLAAGAALAMRSLVSPQTQRGSCKLPTLNRVGALGLGGVPLAEAGVPPFVGAAACMSQVPSPCKLD